MRTSTVERATTETRIQIRLTIEGRGEHDIDTGCGFLDHMLQLFARHGRFDLTVHCDGDTEVDYHHTVEDIGIALGDAFSKALASPSPAQLLAFAPGKEQAAGVWEP